MTIKKSVGGPILCVGIATIDLISLLPSFPESNSRVVAEVMVFAGGGPAATAAVALARLGHQVKLITSVGDDDLGRLAITQLAVEGIDVSAIEKESSRQTSISQVLVNSKSSERLIVTRPDAVGEVAVRKFDFEIPSTWVHIDQTGYRAILARGNRKAIFEKHFISIDGGNNIEGLDLQDVELYVPTIDQLKEIFGHRESVSDLLSAALSAGAKTVVATDGANGCYTLVGSEVWHAPAHRGTVYSTLGAGDVFHGALLGAIVDGKDIKAAMKCANLCAFMSCEGLDGRSAIPRAIELEKALNNNMRSN